MDGKIGIPENAVGRVGMLAALHGIEGSPDGRLAIVRHPVGWVQTLLNARHPVFAWQVVLTGEPAMINGHLRQEIIVADKCLRPVSRLAVADMERVVAQQEQTAVDQAAQQVRDLVGDEAMKSPAFEQTMHLAYEEALLNFANEVVGVKQVLRELDFSLAPGGFADVYEWRSVFEGVEITMSAAKGMLNDWKFSAYAHRERSWHCPEALALNEWPRGRVIQIVLQLWENVYGNRLIPQQLELGWVYRQHQRDLQALIPGLPHADLDGTSFRHALRWLRQAYAVDEWLVGPPKDVPVAVEIKDGLMRVRTDDHDLGVKMHRGWVDAMTLSLRQLLALAPAAVRGHWIRLVDLGEAALVNGNQIQKRNHSA
jgi:hypothetical protein